MVALIQDVRFGCRMLMRAPGFAVLAISILALGVGANTAVFSIVHAVLLRPLPFLDPDRLYQLDEVDPKGQPAGVPPSDLAAFLQYANAFEQAGTSRWHNSTLTGGEGAVNLYGARVSSGMFEMLGVRPVLGQGFRPEQYEAGGAGSVLLSDGLWRRRYGRSATVLNKQLMLDGKAYSVAGVLPAGFFLSQRYEFYIPWQMTAEDLARRELRWPVLVRLKRAMGRDDARTAVEAVFRNTAAQDVARGWRIRLTPIHEKVTGRSRPALLILLGAVGLVLLIACFNIASLLLARGSDRCREMAIRAALGAGRGRVFRQLLTESLLLSTAGGVAGALFGAVLVRLVVHRLPERMAMPRMEQTRMDGPVLLFTLAVSIATGIVFGLAPAWNCWARDVNETLKQGGRGGGGRSHWLRNSLVVAETALSLVLLAGAGLMLRSFVRLVNVDPGFRADRVLSARVPLPSQVVEKVKQAPYYTRLIEAVEGVARVNAVGLIAPLPLAGVDANSALGLEGRPVRDGERRLVKLRAASSGYFRAMGIRLEQGRLFDERDNADGLPVAVVNETLARRYFAGEKSVGKRVSMSSEGKGPWLTIVGVVGDIKSLNLAEKSEPELYRDYRQFLFAPFAITLVIRTQAADPASVATAVERQIRRANPEQPVVDVATMSRVVSESVAQPRFYTLLLGVFAAIAVLLAASGLYGVLSYSVSQRVREIGIRVALGASKRSILREVVGSAMLLVVAGVSIGLAAAVALTRVLAGQLYEVKPTDPATYAAVSVLLTAVGLAAAYMPARRAMAVDPNIALRCE